MGPDRTAARMYYDAGMATSVRMADRVSGRGLPDAGLENLTRINIEDLLAGIGLDRSVMRRALIRLLCRTPARRLAQRILDFDRDIGTVGLGAGSRAVLSTLGVRASVLGAERIPAKGPLLLTANHPGVGDVLLACASVRRDDLRIVAAERPFLRSLAHLSSCLIYVTREGTEARLMAFRQAADHLRRGGALLTFPAGAIEPDPALHEREAASAFDHWSHSIDMLVRRAADTQVIPVLISGVLSRRAQANPLTWLCRERQHREWLGATLQLAFRSYATVDAEITFGSPITVAAAGGQKSSVTDCVIEAMRTLLASCRVSPQHKIGRAHV